jgi:hypothetical protein
LKPAEAQRPRPRRHASMSHWNQCLDDGYGAFTCADDRDNEYHDLYSVGCTPSDPCDHDFEYRGILKGCMCMSCCIYECRKCAMRDY